MDTKNPLIGKSFYQSSGVGYASYHFESKEKVYIRYVEWIQHNNPIKFDDGTIFPEKKYFTNIHFDIEKRIFIGLINWNFPERNTHLGCSYWLYMMHFSEDLKTIDSGYLLDDKFVEVLKFGKDLIYSESNHYQSLQEKKKSIKPTESKLPYFDISNATKELSNSTDIKEASIAGAKLLGKGLFNAAKFAISSAPAATQQIARDSLNRSNEILQRSDLSEEQRDKILTMSEDLKRKLEITEEKTKNKPN